jgi:hypothetical protein
MPRQLYLLTDGAVANTKQIVEYISKKRGTVKVHTFGIGNGVSTELVIECAKAGNGQHYFIDDLYDIEKKVMHAL